MNAQELRLGNYYYYHIIDELDERKEWDEVCRIDVMDLDYLLNYPDDKNYNHIPLTEDWLLKAEFDHFQGWLTKDAFSPGHPSQRFDMYWSSKDGFMMKSRYQEDVPNTFYMRHIKYVYQLQNLYFALTGKELEFKL
jgi:hypothetical protein